MAKRGRPSRYSKALANKICERLAEGESLTSICRPSDMPKRHTVADWAIKDTGGFSAQYTRARDIGLDVVADDVMDIADTDTGDYQRDRLRFDARRWYLSKLAPKRYGEKQQLELSSEGGKPLPIQLVVEPVSARGEKDE